MRTTPGTVLCVCQTQRSTSFGRTDIAFHSFLFAIKFHDRPSRFSSEFALSPDFTGYSISMGEVRRLPWRHQLLPFPTPQMICLGQSGSAPRSSVSLITPLTFNLCLVSDEI